MLNFPLLHPDMLRVLGRAGHGSQVLIADGNYPFRTTLGPNAELVSLNLSPGIVSATDVLAALVAAVPIEAAAVMATATEGPYAMAEDPPIWREFRAILAASGFAEPMEQIERFAFYDAGRGRDVALAIATGEQRIYANVLLTIGVIKPE
jgi:L-fucose mutarotase